MEYSRSTPRQAWSCYFPDKSKLAKLEEVFPMVHFVLADFKLIVSHTGDKHFDSEVKRKVLEMGGYIPEEYPK